MTHAIQKAVEDLKAGRPMPPEESVSFKEYEDILGLPQWAALENEFVGKHEQLGAPEKKAS
jgi:hypothetical protein